MDIKLKNNNYWFNDLVLMFQKEVADRIISKLIQKLWKIIYII